MTMAGWVIAGGDDDWGDYWNKEEVTTYLLPYHLRQDRCEEKKEGVDLEKPPNMVRVRVTGLGLLGSGYWVRVTGLGLLC